VRRVFLWATLSREEFAECACVDGIVQFGGAALVVNNDASKTCIECREEQAIATHEIVPGGDINEAAITGCIEIVQERQCLGCEPSAMKTETNIIHAQSIAGNHKNRARIKEMLGTRYPLLVGSRQPSGNQDLM